MLIPIYYGNRFTFSIIADRRADIVCPQCKHAFRMFDRVGAVGEDFSILGLQNKKAGDAAYDKALKQLGTSAFQFSPVPCPKCGSFHPNMKPLLRWLLGQRILFAGMGLVVALAIGALVIFMRTSIEERLIVLAMGIAALGFLAYRYTKDLRLAPVTVEDIAETSETPPLQVALRFASDGDWTIINT